MTYTDSSGQISFPYLSYSGHKNVGRFTGVCDNVTPEERGGRSRDERKSPLFLYPTPQQKVA